MKRLKNLIPALALVLFGTVVGIFAAEVVTAIFFPQPVLRTTVESVFFVRFDPETGWTNRPGATGAYRPNELVSPFSVRINHLGLRGASVPRKRPPGTMRTLFLGDSNTFGYGLEEDETFTALFASSLPSGHEVLNAGVFGFGADQTLLLFEREGMSLEPDAVILGFSPGDVSDNMSSINAGYSKPYFTLEDGDLTLRNVPVPRELTYLPRSSRNSRLKAFGYARSHLYRLVAHRLFMSERYNPQSLLEMDKEEGLRTTLAIIERLNERCGEIGARLIVLLLPHEDWVAAESREWNTRVGYYPILSMMLARAGVPAIDTTPDFVLGHQKGEKLFLEADPVHVNPAGSRLVASILARYFVRAGLAPDPARTRTRLTSPPGSPSVGRP